MLRKSARIIFCLLAVALIATADKEFAPPRVQHASTYPAHDAHSNESVTIAADPYDRGDKVGIFTVRYNDAGFLPINVIVSNDGGQPVALTDMRVELITAEKTRISPATRDDIQRRFARTPRSGPPPRPSPLPIPRGTIRRPNLAVVDEFNQARFVAKAVEPRANQAGFFFFDVQDISGPLAGARLYVIGVKDSQGNELMYFEIPLDKYLSSRPKP